MSVYNRQKLATYSQKQACALILYEKNSVGRADSDTYSVTIIITVFDEENMEGAP